jgi:hypothetical protein
MLLFITIAYFEVPYEDGYLLEYNTKCDLLKNTPSPRIIFVGGSNLAFGLDSKRISDSLHINIVNYGLHAGVGLKYMIDDIETFVKDGDIVVIAPEYSHFYGLAYGENTLSGVMNVSSFKKTGLLNITQSCHVVLGAIAFIQEKISRLRPSDCSYRASGFNEFGDEVQHWNLPSIDVPTPKSNTAKLDVDFTDYFLCKIKRLQNKARVVIIPPVVRETSFKVQERNINELAEYLNRHGHPFEVNPREHMLPDEYAYDTDYHMNKAGVDIFTGKIIKILSPIVHGEHK